MSTDSAGARSRRWWWITPAVITGLALLAASALYTTGVWSPGSSDNSARHSSSELLTVETGFDLENASFYLAPDNRPYYLFGDKYPFDLADRKKPQKVQLTDGVYYPPDASGNDPHMRIDPDNEPEYQDLDGDGNRDAVAVLEWVDESHEPYTSWKGAFIWLWSGDQATPVNDMAAWQWWNCPGDAVFELHPYGRVHQDGDASCDGDEHGNVGEIGSSPSKQVVDGTVVDRQHNAPVGNCGVFHTYEDDETYVIDTDLTPRVKPDRNADPVDEGFEELHLRLGPDPDRSLYGGWILARVIWPEGVPGCGWVHWDDIGDDLKPLH